MKREALVWVHKERERTIEGRKSIRYKERDSCGKGRKSYSRFPDRGENAGAGSWNTNAELLKLK